MRYPIREYQADQPSRKVFLFIPLSWILFHLEEAALFWKIVVRGLDTGAHHIRGGPEAGEGDIQEGDEAS
jgi:hypothetical protein